MFSQGTVRSSAGDYVELAGRNVMSKAFDDRIACYIQTEALKRIQSSYHDLYFVYTVQEEVGLFGSTTSAETVKPDLGIAVDITGSFDVPGMNMVIRFLEKEPPSKSMTAV